jgi:hypothetical protein
MPSTTSRDTASAFQKKSPAPTAVPWSGRLDMAESTRPGGLLTAALMQCAAERKLSHTELATALGVSYWSLSQLRIGFRPIASLDDDMIEACAAFLDLPPLTVQALAGLLTPDDVLDSADLSAEDLLHARQMRRTEPAQLVLLPPPNRARPLQGWSVDDLAELHREHADKAVVMALLRTELGLRPFSKTELLRAAVAPTAAAATETTAPRTGNAPSGGILSCLRCQKRLRIPHLPEPSEIRCPCCGAEYAVHWQGAVCLVQALPDTETGDDEESDTDAPATGEPKTPWDVLNLAPNSPWDQVERARRSLLQQYHPDRLGHVSPLVRALAESAFKRVSDAYETLKAQR